MSLKKESQYGEMAKNKPQPSAKERSAEIEKQTEIFLKNKEIEVLEDDWRFGQNDGYSPVNSDSKINL